MTDPTVQELDMRIEAARGNDLPPKLLLELQSEIASLRYTLGEMVAKAENQMLLIKEQNEMQELREVLKRQAVEPKLSTVKAEALVKDTMEVQRQTYLRAKLDYDILKHKWFASTDTLMSLAQRIKNAESDNITSRMAQNVNNR